MSRVLILGAGFVAGPLVNYLLKCKHQITIASQFLDEAKTLADGHDNVAISELDVNNQDFLGSLISQHDLTISLVPFQFHVIIAKQCIKYQKHLVTASYESTEMSELNQQAKDSNITILNEIGLDPGIDHLSAMHIIDSIHEQGGTLKSFISWCGGLPSPDANNNPLGYKFAWAPKSVLLALLNDAIYLKAGGPVTVPSEQLLNNVQEVIISPELKLEGYPNRNSVNYRDSYGIHDAHDVLRGTLRYPGFSEIMQCCKEIGLLDTESNLSSDIEVQTSWRKLIENKMTDFDDYLASQSEHVIEALKWLGLLDSGQVVTFKNSMINTFCSLLIDKLSYAEDETDMVVLQHQFTSENIQGKTEIRESTLILEGDIGGYSAMAKTVGTPAAIAVDLILTGEINRKGVILPMTKDIYEPIIIALEQQGIIIKETMVIK